jgi:hypothetical protein
MSTASSTTLALAGDIGPVLLGRPQRNFFMPEADPAERVVDRRQPRPHPQAPLQLGQRDVRRRLDQPCEGASYGLSRGRRCPPYRAGAALPVVRTRCISLIAADGLTANRRATARIELPRSTARAIRIRKSKDIGGGMSPLLARLNRYCRITGTDSTAEEIL